MRSSGHRLGPGGWAVVVALLVALPFVHVLRKRSMDRYLATQTYEDIYYLPPPAWLEVFSLGYDEAAADLIWMRGLVYFGDELFHRGQVKHIFDYGDAIVGLDPDFKRAYRWVEMAALYNAKTTLTVADIERARRFLARGVRRFPDDGEMNWEMGALLAYELAPHIDDPAEKKRILTQATTYLTQAASEGAGPAWLALSNAAELQRLGRNEEAAQHLEEMYGLVKDPATREQIRLTIEHLKSAAYAEALARANQQFEQQRQKDYPYIPPGLYLLVRPKPVVDEKKLIDEDFVPGGDTGPEQPR